MIESGEGVPFCATTQDRPFNNEIKLIHPNKRTTYPANRVRKEGDRLVIGFETAPYEAVVEVRAFIFERGGGRCVAYWHVSGDGTLLLPDGTSVPVGDRRYWRTSMSADAIRELFRHAVIQPS